MKKTYQQPILEINNIQMASMIATSNNFALSSATDYNGQVLGSRRDIWEDEEEDELEDF